MSSTRSPNRNVAKSRNAFSLAEVVVSIAVFSILIMAMGSAVFVAGRSVEDGTSDAARTFKAADVMTQINADLQVAQKFITRTATNVKVEVPDRDGDDIEDTIEYAWSGTAGDPIYRTFNNGTPIAIADDVELVTFDFVLTQTSEPPEEEEETDEQALIYHNDASGGSMVNFTLSGQWWCAQYFKPTFPPNAVRWSITKVKFMAKREPPELTGMESFEVQITAADAAFKPTVSVYESKVVQENELGASYAWKEILFSTINALTPSQGACLVIKQPGLAGNAGKIQYEQGDPLFMTPNTHFTSTLNAGLGWSEAQDMQDMRFYVYGTVTILVKRQYPTKPVEPTEPT